MQKYNTILAIESSCDDTSAAVMQGGVLKAQVTSSQLVHAAHGGPVPELAAREHQALIMSVVKATLQRAHVPITSVDVLAVTQGPGLLGSLLVGISFANGLAFGRGIPLVGVHHTRAHLLANFVTPPHPRFPFLGLIISGGHTQLVVARDPLDMKILGTTRDDAVGEAFDKIARGWGPSM